MSECTDCPVKRELDEQSHFHARGLAEDRKRISSLEGVVFRLEKQLAEFGTEE